MFGLTSPDSPSSVNRHLTKTCSAVGTLKERISVLRAFLVATKDGRIPTDHALLRQISSICNRLPAISSDKFRGEFLSVRDHETQPLNCLCLFCPGIASPGVRLCDEHLLLFGFPVLLVFTSILQEFNDTLLLAYLATVTKGAHAVNSVRGLPYRDLFSVF